MLRVPPGAEHEHLVATHPCEWAHEGESCSGSALRFLPGAFARALPVYLPVYVLPAILVHRSGASSDTRASPEAWRVQTRSL